MKLTTFNDGFLISQIEIMLESKLIQEGPESYRIETQYKHPDDLWYFENPERAIMIPGQIIRLRIGSTFGDDKSADVLAVVTGINYSHDRMQGLDVMFWTKWRSGEVSGSIEIKDLMAWRYLSPYQNFTKDELEFIRNTGVVDEYKLFFVKSMFHSGEGQTKRELIYPFKTPKSLAEPDGTEEP